MIKLELMELHGNKVVAEHKTVFYTFKYFQSIAFIGVNRNSFYKDLMGKISKQKMENWEKEKKKKN